MDEKPNDQHLNSVNDGGNILNSPKPDERTQLDTDIENTQKELPKEKSVCCGNFTFSRQCSALDFFHHDIYGHVTVDLCHFEESIIWGNFQPTQTNKGPIELGIGLKIKVDGVKFPEHSEDFFVLFGFVADKKKPGNNKAIVFSDSVKQFFVVLISHLRVHAEPINAPEVVQDLFGDYKTWLTDIASHKSLLDLYLLPTKQHKNTKSPGLQLPERRSKRDAKRKILDMSPQKNAHPSKNIKTEPNTQVEIQKGLPCSCLNEVKRLEKENSKLSSAVTKLKSELKALSGRVAHLEHGESSTKHLHISKTSYKKQAAKNEFPLSNLAEDSVLKALKTAIKEEIQPLKDQQGQPAQPPTAVGPFQSPPPSITGTQLPHFPFMFMPAQTMQQTPIQPQSMQHPPIRSMYMPYPYFFS